MDRATSPRIALVASGLLGSVVLASAACDTATIADCPKTCPGTGGATSSASSSSGGGHGGMTSSSTSSTGTSSSSSTSSSSGTCTTAPQNAPNCTNAPASCSGTPEWSIQEGDLTNVAQGTAVAFDQGGNLLVAGSYTGTFGACPAPTSGGASNFSVMKLSPTGGTVWQKCSGSTTNAQAFGVATDDCDNVYVVGSFSKPLALGGSCGMLIPASSSDLFVAVLHPSNGTCRFAKNFGTTGAQQPSGVAVTSGGIYVTGTFSGSLDFGGSTTAFSTSGPTSIFVAELTPITSVSPPPLTGVWSRSIGTTMSNPALAVLDQGGPNDGVAIAGGFKGTANFGQSPLVSTGPYYVYVAKYDLAGTPEWSKPYSTTADAFAHGVAIDPKSGKVWLTGQMTGGSIDFGSGPTPTGQGAFLAMRSSDGTTGSGTLFADTMASGDSGMGVAVDSAGQVTITGTLNGTATFGGKTLATMGSGDVFVVKLKNDGTSTIWGESYGGLKLQGANAVAADAHGNLGLTGLFQGSLMISGDPLSVTGTGQDAFAALLSP